MNSERTVEERTLAELCEMLDDLVRAVQDDCTSYEHGSGRREREVKEARAEIIAAVAAALSAARERESRYRRDGYVAGLNAGAEVAEMYAEVADNEGWSKTARVAREVAENIHERARRALSDADGAGESEEGR